MGRSAGHTGADNDDFADDVQGTAGDITFSAQGNILTGAAVLTQAAAAMRGPGCDLAERLMRAVEGGARNGQGDQRCTPFAAPGDSAFIQVDRPGEPAGSYLRLRIDGPVHRNPLPALRAQLDGWRTTHPCPTDAPDAAADGPADARRTDAPTAGAGGAGAGAGGDGPAGGASGTGAADASGPAPTGGASGAGAGDASGPAPTGGASGAGPTAGTSGAGAAGGAGAPGGAGAGGGASTAPRGASPPGGCRCQTGSRGAAGAGSWIVIALLAGRRRLTGIRCRCRNPRR